MAFGIQRDRPILRKMFFSQIGIGLAGISLIGISILLIAFQSYSNEVVSRREHVGKYIDRMHERWRAWAILDLHGPLENELTRVSKELNLNSLQLISRPTEEMWADRLTVIVPPRDQVLDQEIDRHVVAKLKAPSSLFWNRIRNLLGVLGLTSCLFLAVLVFSLLYLQKHIGKPIDQFLVAFEKVSLGEQLNVARIDAKGEMARLKDEIERMYRTAIDLEQKAALAQIAAQVSHDIRSPLSALNVVASEMKDVSAEKLELMTKAIGRINSIADDLLKRHRMTSLSASSGSIHSNQLNSQSNFVVSEVVTDIVNEKRIEASGRGTLEIRLDCSESETARCKVDRAAFERALSNIVNNAIEAIDGPGVVTVALRSTSQSVAVIIQDTGKGIPPEVLCQLGKVPVTKGKSEIRSGSGIGVLSAKSTLERGGGSLSYLSKVGQGTIVTVVLPRSL